MYGVKTMAITAGLDMSGTVVCSLANLLMPTVGAVRRVLESDPAPHECVLLLSHIGGWINPDISAIAELCRSKRTALVEDCAHSLGAVLEDRHSGLYGLAGVYSLYATKAIPAGEGGIVITNDSELGELTQRFTIYDRFRQEMNIGVNVRMSEPSALLAYAVLLETENIIANKMDIAARYSAACDRVGLAYFQAQGNNFRSNLYKFIVLDRQRRLEDLKFSKIKTRTSSVYDYALGDDPDQITRRHVCLPIWYMLEEEVIAKVCAEIEQC
jgi:dTDP-4-amino-4,6-dideoxygalactose transaminase